MHGALPGPRDVEQNVIFQRDLIVWLGPVLKHSCTTALDHFQHCLTPPVVVQTTCKRDQSLDMETCVCCIVVDTNACARAACAGWPASF